MLSSGGNLFTAGSIFLDQESGPMTRYSAVMDLLQTTTNTVGDIYAKGGTAAEKAGDLSSALRKLRIANGINTAGGGLLLLSGATRLTHEAWLYLQGNETNRDVAIKASEDFAQGLQLMANQLTYLAQSGQLKGVGKLDDAIKAAGGSVNFPMAIQLLKNAAPVFSGIQTGVDIKLFADTFSDDQIAEMKANGMTDGQIQDQRLVSGLNAIAGTMLTAGLLLANPATAPAAGILVPTAYGIYIFTTLYSMRQDIFEGAQTVGRLALEGGEIAASKARDDLNSLTAMLTGEYDYFVDARPGNPDIKPDKMSLAIDRLVDSGRIHPDIAELVFTDDLADTATKMYTLLQASVERIETQGLASNGRDRIVTEGDIPGIDKYQMNTTWDEAQEIAKRVNRARNIDGQTAVVVPDGHGGVLMYMGSANDIETQFNADQQNGRVPREFDLYGATRQVGGLQSAAYSEAQARSRHEWAIGGRDADRQSPSRKVNQHQGRSPQKPVEIASGVGSSANTIRSATDTAYDAFRRVADSPSNPYSRLDHASAAEKPSL